MAVKGSGLFMFTIGKAMSQYAILIDGTISLPYGKGREIVVTDVVLDPYAEAYTRAEVVRALVAAQRGIRNLDVVRSAGLDLAVKAGKGRATIADLLVRRMGAENAAPVIAAMAERYIKSLES